MSADRSAGGATGAESGIGATGGAGRGERSSAGSLPLPASPNGGGDALAGTPSGAASGNAGGGVGGIPRTATSGVVERQAARSDSPTGAAAGVAPAERSGGAPDSGETVTRGPLADEAARALPATSPRAGQPTQAGATPDGEPGRDDSALESLGKSIAAPVTGAIDDDALPPAQPPERPPGRG